MRTWLTRALFWLFAIPLCVLFWVVVGVWLYALLAMISGRCP